MLSAFELLSNPQADILTHPRPLDEGLRAAEDSHNKFAASILSVTKEVMYFIADDLEAAVETMNRRLSKFSRIEVEGSVLESVAYYLEGLIAFAALREEKSRGEMRKLLKHARRSTRNLKMLSNNNPSTCLAKYLLLEAEEAAMKKKYPIAREKYSNAIALAKNKGSFVELAFANQAAAAHFLHDLHDVDSALGYLRAAREAYALWGAHAGVTHLARRIDVLESRQI
jgi:tetratricopeptide (TPR) repeat protein